MADEVAAGPTSSPRAPETGPDIQLLAEKVYRLLVAEARLDRARNGTGSSRGRG
jgi:hypothetical protein